MYQVGIGVPQDRHKAIAFFKKAEDQDDKQAGFFVRWLSKSENCLGYRDDIERQKFAGVCSDPAGLTFHSKRERYAWLQKNSLRP